MGRIGLDVVLELVEVAVGGRLRAGERVHRVAGLVGIGEAVESCVDAVEQVEDLHSVGPVADTRVGDHVQVDCNRSLAAAMRQDVPAYVAELDEDSRSVERLLLVGIDELVVEEVHMLDELSLVLVLYGKEGGLDDLIDNLSHKYGYVKVFCSFSAAVRRCRLCRQ